MGDEIRLRVRMVHVGLALSALLLLAMGAWIGFTWAHPHRGALLGLTLAAASLTAGIALLPHERIVAAARREVFFLAWSLSLVGFVGVAAALDAGVRSPVVLILFLTLVYAALSYPRWSVAVVTAASLLTVLGLGRIPGSARPPTDPVYLAGLMFTLAVTGIMCMMQARIQEQARDELVRVARRDALTGALNRLGFEERLGRELARGDRELPIGFVLLDFDDFKGVNDRHGHAAGDELLRWAASAIEAVLRPDDALARLGGDEFAVMLAATEPAEADRVARRVQLALAERVGVSVGIALGDRGETGTDLLYRRADLRLYADKRARTAAVAV